MLLLAVIALDRAAIERSRSASALPASATTNWRRKPPACRPCKLKLIATTLSGGFMGMAGAPFPFYIGYLHPSSAFGLNYAVNSIAMPLIGGTTSWVGPLVGAVLLGSAAAICGSPSRRRPTC
jgi:branched-chain amino acid transport system permease protein